MNNDAIASIIVVVGVLLLAFAVLIWQQRGINRYCDRVKTTPHYRYRIIRGVLVRGPK